MEITTFYMLWSDNKPLSESVRKALEHYQKKYGAPPTIIQTSFHDEPVLVDGLVIERASLPKGHLLMGELLLQEQKWSDEG